MTVKRAGKAPSKKMASPKVHTIPKLAGAAVIVAKAIKGEGGKYRIAAQLREKAR